jgi:AcrR family transcriptional regulator
MRSKQDLLGEIVVETTEQVWAGYLAAVDGVDDVAERLRRALRVYALRHATRRREALIVNQDAGHLEEPVRSRVFELRRRHENAIRGLIEEGVASGRFHDPTPSLASFGILEMCVSIACWFRLDGALSAEAVADTDDLHATAGYRRAMTAEHTRRALLRLRAQPEGVRREG